MNEEYVELYDTIAERPVPLFVGTFGNWEQAIEEAAKRPNIEIVVVSERSGLGLVVYSDNYTVHSSDWWATQVRKARQFYGTLPS